MTAHTISRSFGFALLSASLTAVVLAQAPALDVKMGLWEITTNTDVGGQMPTVDTSKMTPQQKAQVEAMMKSSMGAHTNVKKSCITKEEFDKSNFMGTDQPGSTCKHTLTTNTHKTLDSSMVCTGARPATAQMHIDALSPTNVKANMDYSTTDQGKTMTMKFVMTGKWLGADCGNIK